MTAGSLLLVGRRIRVVGGGVHTLPATWDPGDVAAEAVRLGRRCPARPVSCLPGPDDGRGAQFC